MKIPVKSESILEIILDFLMMPIMYVLQANLFEVPQRTHFWNNTKFESDTLHWLRSGDLVTVAGDQNAVKRWFGYIPIFHMPIFGGWKRYVVIEPAVTQDQWFIGWIAGDTAGLSRVVLKTPVRLLLGSGPAQFFGVNEHGEQIKLQLIGEGEVRKRSKFSKLPLL